jgi:ribosomal protein S12 methylthiotransferase
VLQLHQGVPAPLFDRVGVFTYSKEEGTRAAELDGHLPDEVKERRRDALMELQQGIQLKKNREWVGYSTDVIVDGISEEHELVFEGRHYGQAPDIDGKVFLSFDYGGDMPTAGDMVDVEITEATPYDLRGVVLPDEPPAPIAIEDDTASVSV